MRTRASVVDFVREPRLMVLGRRGELVVDAADDDRLDDGRPLEVCCGGRKWVGSDVLVDQALGHRRRKGEDGRRGVGPDGEAPHVSSTGTSFEFGAEGLQLLHHEVPSLPRGNNFPHCASVERGIASLVLNSELQRQAKAAGVKFAWSCELHICHDPGSTSRDERLARYLDRTEHAKKGE